jgi:hypothetical protein
VITILGRIFEDAVERFVNAVVDRLIEHWVEQDQPQIAPAQSGDVLDDLWWTA